MATFPIYDDLAEPISAHCTADEIIVNLASGLTVHAPLAWYDRLSAATPAQRSNIEVSPFGLHWPEIDEDLSIEGILSRLRSTNPVSGAPTLGL